MVEWTPQQVAAAYRESQAGPTLDSTSACPAAPGRSCALHRTTRLPSGPIGSVAGRRVGPAAGHRSPTRPGQPASCGLPLFLRTAPSHGDEAPSRPGRVGGVSLSSSYSTAMGGNVNGTHFPAGPIRYDGIVGEGQQRTTTRGGGGDGDVRREKRPSDGGRRGEAARLRRSLPEGRRGVPPQALARGR